MFRRFCGVQASRHRRDLAAGGIHSRRGCSVRGPGKARFAGVQVRMPISELKAWLTEKMAF